MAVRPLLLCILTSKRMLVHAFAWLKMIKNTLKLPKTYFFIMCTRGSVVSLLFFSFSLPTKQDCCGIFRGKSSFFGNKQSTSVMVQTKIKLFFAEFCCKFLAFFRGFAAKTLKMAISTSVWSAQHPNAGQSIQHLS